MDIKKIGKIISFLGITIFGLGFLRIIPISYGNDILIVVAFIFYLLGWIFQNSEKGGGFKLDIKNILFLVGSFLFVVGLIFRILYYPYSSQLLLLGVVLHIWSRFTNPNTGTEDNYSETIDDNKDL